MSGERYVTLYTKPACGLCDEIKSDLYRLQAEFSFTVREVDITSDPIIFRRFQYLIPVIEFMGGMALFAPIDPVELHEALAEAFTP